MADDAVYDTIKDYLSNPPNVAILADPDGSHAVPEFRFENEPFEKPNPPVPWIAMALTGVLYGQESIGAHTQADNRWDETGNLWLSVFTAKDSGASRARQIAKGLANIFRGLTLIEGDLEFLDAFIGQGIPAPEEGNWFEIPVVIEWRRVEA